MISKIKNSYLLFFFIFIFVFIADRISKYYIINSSNLPKVVNNFLVLSKTFNRGISWGLLSNESNIIYWLVTFFVIFITLFVVYFARERFRSGNLILGEILVISGSLSNIYDRFVYGAVVDFINVNIGSWQYPGIFNLADCAIVIGVLIMFFQLKNN